MSTTPSSARSAEDDANTAAKSRVLVFARCRPPSEKEHARGDGDAMLIRPEQDQITVKSDSDAIDRVLSGQPINAVPEGQNDKSFVYDGCFAPESSQKEVFTLVGLPVLVEVMKGFNGCVLAYGQTGSGKTYSLLNTGADAEQAGLLPRLVATMFVRAAMDPKHVYSIEAAAFQVYNEQVDDLLHPQFGKKDGGGNNLNVSKGTVQNVTWKKCTKPTEMLELFAKARSGITYAETKMNKASSRSHAAFQIKIIKRPRATAGNSGQGTQRMHATVGKLTVVDLAGSERVKKSGVTGANFKEATNINGSLLALGNVIQALASKRKHVPFRDSKLTRILEGSVGGNCKTSLLVCVSPASTNVSESLSTLEFANRAMRVEVQATVNETIVEVDPARLAADLQANPAEYMDDDTLKAYRESEEALKHAREQAKHHEQSLKDYESKMKEMEDAVSRKQLEIEQAKHVSEQKVKDLRKSLDSVELEKKKHAAKVSDLQNLLRKREDSIKASEASKVKEIEKVRKEINNKEKEHDMKLKQLKKQQSDAENVWNAKYKAMEDKKVLAENELKKLQKTLKDLHSNAKKAQSTAATESKAKQALKEELDHAKEKLTQLEVDIDVKDQDINKKQMEVTTLEQRLEESMIREQALKDDVKRLEKDAIDSNERMLQFESKVSALEKTLQREADILSAVKEAKESLEKELELTKQDLKDALSREEEWKGKNEGYVKKIAWMEQDFESKFQTLKEEQLKKIEGMNTTHQSAIERQERHAQEALTALEVRAKQDTEKFQNKMQQMEELRTSESEMHKQQIQDLEHQIKLVEQQALQRQVDYEEKADKILREVKQEREAAEERAKLRLVYTIAANQAANDARARERGLLMEEYKTLEQRFISRESRREDLDLIKQQQRIIRDKEMVIRDSVREIRKKEHELEVHKKQDRIFGIDASKKRSILPGRYVGEHATFKERAQVVPSGNNTSSKTSLGYSNGQASSSSLATVDSMDLPRPGTADPFHGRQLIHNNDRAYRSMQRSPRKLSSDSMEREIEPISHNRKKQHYNKLATASNPRRPSKGLNTAIPQGSPRNNSYAA